MTATLESMQAVKTSCFTFFSLNGRPETGGHLKLQPVIFRTVRPLDFTPSSGPCGGKMTFWFAQANSKYALFDRYRFTIHVQEQGREQKARLQRGRTPSRRLSVVDLVGGPLSAGCVADRQSSETLVASKHAMESTEATCAPESTAQR
jgi:hypothetical protein